MTDPWLTQNTAKNHELTDTSAPKDSDAVDENIGSVLVEHAEGRSESGQRLEFEDNFAPSPAAIAPVDDVGGQEERTTQSSDDGLQPLPDSASYLQGLERKLQRLKKGTKLVEALAEKRQDCLRTLLQDNDVESVVNNNAILELDASINNGDSAVQEIYRHLQPVQPVTVGETVHIVHYDHLEQLRQEVEKEEEKSETESNFN